MNVVGAIKDLWLIQNVVGFVSIMAHNVSCMSSGTCTHLKLSYKLSVPLLIHVVSGSTDLKNEFLI
jgi:hypothetical protein